MLINFLVNLKCHSKLALSLVIAIKQVSNDHWTCYATLELIKLVINIDILYTEQFGTTLLFKYNPEKCYLLL